MIHWIDGRFHAAQIKARLQIDVADVEMRHQRRPGLHTIIVGKQKASHDYVRLKLKAAASVGLNGTSRQFPEDVTETELIFHIQQMNADDDVDGILVQLPLPAHLNVSRIIHTIAPEKDVDGFHPQSAASLITDSTGFVPCTPLGCLYLLYAEGIQPKGLGAVVVGRSAIVGRPMAHLLLRENATVTSCHRHTQDLYRHTRAADIVICATGVPHLFRPEHFKDGAIVIDVGQGRLPLDGGQDRLVGDVDKDALDDEKYSLSITPVPGGVGPMTIAMLLANTVEAYRRRTRAALPTLRERFHEVLPDV